MKKNNAQQDNNKKPKSDNGFYQFCISNLAEKDSFGGGMESYEVPIRKRIKELESSLKLIDVKKIDKVKEQIKKLKEMLLNSVDMKIYFYLRQRMGYGNLVRLNESQTTIADKLILPSASVKRSFRKLKKIGVISYHIENKRMVNVRISPFLEWRGDGETHNNVIHELVESFKSPPFAKSKDYQEAMKDIA
ncbi:hypothetical protein [Halomonas sp. HAL1]|uniref:hypothetical protein n=1 Tax=Halomonas sp. HAL1 TaxID=550984 RepID=UPI00022D2C2B|nr:hypothetical protein [Halomonas sp. HAL1]EHA17145.1 hypothetical protein HAL1_03087 [Halomonas sp. HAL1]WKV92872.1 hypothetical protein Q3Y66_18830 [Halomonas sp. HAL1]